MSFGTMNRSLLAAAVLMSVFVILGGCNTAGPGSPAGGHSGTIKIIGSNTVTPLTSVWAEDFMKANPGVNIAVSGPGSGVGIAALIDGTTDICQSSRKITPREIEQAKAKGVEPYEIQVASDGLAVVVNRANPVSELTIAQLSAIYTGKVTNWKDVGGKDAPVVAIARDTNSGTHVFFKEHVVQMEGLPTADRKLEYGDRVLFLPSTEEAVSEVARSANAIFYPGLAYVSGSVKVLAVKKTANDPAVLPGEATVLSGAYPIARPLLFYTNGAPSGIMKAFVDYCLSPEGQKEVSKVGYVPLTRS